MRIASLLRPAAMMVAAGVLAGMAAPAQAQMVGAFNACYRNKPMPGGVGVSLNLVVVTPSKTMTGTAVATQATNPPLHVMLPVAGSYREGPRRHIAQLESPMLPGYHIKMALVFSSNWKSASGTYTLWLDTPNGAKKGKIALRQTACMP